ncbi:MAG TPA: apolipoprotein N-acyltransferase [Acetobacteraceae bacterium]|nr:apolipoprotein N-acyltransferase [Acetobacteraceae bacterium]
MARWLAALRGWRADLAALGAGLLAALALPPLHGLPVLLLAIPALMLLIDGARDPWVAARRGWWFGFGLNLVGLYWITEAILVEAARFWWCVPLAVPALAATLAVFIGFAALIARLAPAGWWRLLALAGGWVLGDLARQFIGTGFPWNPLGSVWELPGRAGDVLIQPAALVGVHGLTLATVLLAGLPLLGWGFRAAGAALLAAWIGFGLVRTAAPAPPPSGVTAVLVQGDVAEGQKWSPSLARGIFERYLALTAEGVRQAGAGRKVVIWPETASPYLLGVEPLARQAIAEAAEDSPALVGSVRFDAKGRPRNTLYALEPDGAVAALYDKWHLVPFGEYQPSWFPLPIQIVPGGGFAGGPGPRTLRVPGLPPVAPLICYEAIFSAQVVDESARPDWIVNVTNDAWFGNSTGPRQHLAAVRMRAVEEGLPVLRAANTGITAAIDARGHEVARIGLNQPGVLVVGLPPPLPPTPYAQLGLAIPLGLGGLATLIGLAGRACRPVR